MIAFKIQPTAYISLNESLREVSAQGEDEAIPKNEIATPFGLAMTA
jgi:hypothetical protein